MISLIIEKKKIEEKINSRENIDLVKNYKYLIVIFTIISLIGMYIHNSDLQGLTIFSAENSIPTLITLLLLLLWLSLPSKKITGRLLLGWAILNLIGGILSAFPFSFWTLGRLQTTEHFLKHTIYAIAQLPLIILLIKKDS